MSLVTTLLKSRISLFHHSLSWFLEQMDLILTFLVIVIRIIFLIAITEDETAHLREGLERKKDDFSDEANKIEGFSISTG